jgi:HD domain-containing protein
MTTTSWQPHCSTTCPHHGHLHPKLPPDEEYTAQVALAALTIIGFLWFYRTAVRTDLEAGGVRMKTLMSLPSEVSALLAQLGAMPRLVAHLTLVHDVACQIMDRFAATWPKLSFDHNAVLYGAATHDIGKVAHPEELRQPGHLHEEAGEKLLRDHGVSEELARFARTHAQWTDDNEPRMENLLVALSDSWWRGKRDAALEEAICQRIAAQTGEPTWRVFAMLDDIAAEVTADADARLA